MKRRVHKKYLNTLKGYSRCTSKRARALIKYAKHIGIRFPHGCNDKYMSILKQNKHVYVYLNYLIDGTYVNNACRVDGVAKHLVIRSASEDLGKKVQDKSKYVSVCSEFNFDETAIVDTINNMMYHYECDETLHSIYVTCFVRPIYKGKTKKKGFLPIDGDTKYLEETLITFNNAINNSLQ